MASADNREEHPMSTVQRIARGMAAAFCISLLAASGALAQGRCVPAQRGKIHFKPGSAQHCCDTFTAGRIAITGGI